MGRWNMKIVGQRLRALRESVKMSQTKIGALFGCKQSSINRYESGEASAPYEVLLQYADHFDVSMDYIFGRTDNPQGKLYENKPKVEKIYPEMEKFIEMCFDPGSPMNERLKESLLQMMKEGTE